MDSHNPGISTTLKTYLAEVNCAAFLRQLIVQPLQVDAETCANLDAEIYGCLANHA